MFAVMPTKRSSKSPSHIARNIRLYRRDAGYSQGELAAAIGVTGQTISNIERDLQTPQLGTLRKIADVLGISLDTITREDESESTRILAKIRRMNPEEQSRLFLELERIRDQHDARTTREVPERRRR